MAEYGDRKPEGHHTDEHADNPLFSTTDDHQVTGTKFQSTTGGHGAGGTRATGAGHDGYEEGKPAGGKYRPTEDAHNPLYSGTDDHQTGGAGTNFQSATGGHGVGGTGTTIGTGAGGAGTNFQSPTEGYEEGKHAGGHRTEEGHRTDKHARNPLYSTTEGDQVGETGTNFQSTTRGVGGTTGTGHGCEGGKHEGGGVVEKIKEKLPGGDHGGDKQYKSTSGPIGGGGGSGYEDNEAAELEKKGLLEKIKEKLPGGHK